MRPLLYFFSVSLVVLAWSMATPPWAGPDEAAQYIKALGTVSADPVGHAADWKEREISATPAQQAYFAHTSRSFPISSPLAPRIPTVPCFAYRATVNASCDNHPATGAIQRVSYVGTYQPVFYVLPGLAAQLGSSPVGGLRWARVAGALEFLALLAMALALLDADGRGPPPFGVLLVLTPMTLSLAGTFSSSGFEIGSAMVFMSAAIRVGRGQPSSRLLAITVISGTLLAWSRPLGPLWVAGAVALAGCMADGRTVAFFKHRPTRIAILATAVASLGSIAWDVALGFGGGTSRTSVSAAVHQLVSTASLLGKEQIGIFGYLDTYLPQSAYLLGAVLLCVVLIAAFVAGRARERVALGIGGAFYALVALAFVVTTTNTGFQLQGRYLLPVWALIAVVAGETLRRAAEKRTYGRLARTASALWMALFGLLNVGAVYISARRYAVGAGHSWLFFRAARWSPPGGWAPWLIVLALALAGLLLAAVRELQPPVRGALIPEYAQRADVPSP